MKAYFALPQVHARRYNINVVKNFIFFHLNLIIYAQGSLDFPTSSYNTLGMGVSMSISSLSTVHGVRVTIP